MQIAGSLGHLAMAKELRRSQVLRPIIWLGVLARGGPGSMWTCHV